MKNKKFDGKSMDYKNNTGSDIASGDIVELEDRIAVAAVDITDGGAGTADLVGVFELPKTNPEVIAQGDKLYYDTVTGLITGVSGGNTINAGLAHEAAVSAADVCLVRLQDA